jgi:RHS repeat-associated protein
VYDVFGAVTARTGSTASIGKFTGEQADDGAGDSGYYFLRARHYDPATGRFVGQDKIEFAQRYAYASNNPCSMVDPSGLAPSIACRTTFQAYDLFQDAINLTLFTAELFPVFSYDQGGFGLAFSMAETKPGTLGLWQEKSANDRPKEGQIGSIGTFEMQSALRNPFTYVGAATFAGRPSINVEMRHWLDGLGRPQFSAAASSNGFDTGLHGRVTNHACW